MSKGKNLFVLSEGKKSFAVFKGLESWCAWSPWYHGFGMTTQGWSSNELIGAYEKKVKFWFGKIGVHRNLTDLFFLYFSDQEDCEDYDPILCWIEQFEKKWQWKSLKK